MSEFNQQHQKVNQQYNADVINFHVIHESSVGAIVRTLTGSCLNEDSQQVEEQIKSFSDDPAQLQAILVQTLSHILREGKKRFKRQEGLFNFSDGMEGKELRERKEADTTDRKRLDLCQKVLDKLHDSGRQSRDTRVLAMIDRIDDCLVSTEQMLSKLKSVGEGKGLAALAIPGVLFFVIGGFGVHPAILLIALLYAAGVGAGYRYVYCTQRSIGKHLTELEAILGQLSEGQL